MKHDQFHWEHAGIPKRLLSTLLKKLSPEIDKVKKALKKKYETAYASLSLPHDTKQLRAVETLAKKYKKAGALVVVGIGGSDLGIIAIVEALRGKEHNVMDKKEIYFAETVDPFSIEQIQSKMKEHQKKKEKVVLIIISKSGGTTEPLVNFQVLLKTHKNQKNWKSHTVFITGKGSKLSQAADKLDCPQLEIPPLVGGRYSVFSAVGLFPLAVLGVDVRALLKGARDVQQDCLSKKTSKNPAALGAAIQFHHNRKGLNIFNLFLFNPNLEHVGKWYRQLMGESVGKEFNRTGKKRVHTGITPIVSIGSTDLHSMAQLYFGGPRDKYTQFITLHDHADKIKIPKEKIFADIVEDVQGKTVTDVMNAIEKGVHTTYKKLKLPHTKIELEKRDSYNLGGLLQLKMIEMIYLAFLLDVNPFDQPNVELYKRETKKILKGRNL
ncbi:hypothetical protein CMO92_00705 [Candidatus Woesearchaeota archaeon]|nr:hypothetical protein [Candidatus Woesearchaeota archaeon]|tara:strand:+ start:1716 stop:3029 length:1314 start_codon:yes stop_codon:yes gene_type:complete